MAKTDFTKVEELLVQGLRKMSIDSLLELADQQSSESNLSEKQHQIVVSEARRLVIASLRQDIRHLKKQKIQLEKQFGLRKKGIQKMIDHPETLTADDWEKIKNIQKEIAHFKEEWSKQLPISTDEQIVESERIKHINKRFNTNERWLPLH